MNFFATTPKGLELLLVNELQELGATDAAEKLAGVAFSGELELAYKACLWSRLANRILLRIAQFPATTPEELYTGIQTINWSEHLDVSQTLKINFISSQSIITHTLFGAQKVKDAIVDQFREKYGERPSVARDNPDLSVHVYLHRDTANISIDLSGESLHKREYRLSQGEAPLKENLAAAILLRAGWKEISKSAGTLLDPMCGSGTLLIEGAMLAGDIAPGLSRNYFGFLGWKKHNPTLWDNLLQEAKQRQEQGVKLLPRIIGYDIDEQAIENSIENIERAGLSEKIQVEQRELASCLPPENIKTGLVPGLIIVNPPYGERLGEISELNKLYAQLGQKLKENFLNWHAAVFTGNPDLGKNMGLRAHRSYALFNGAIPCQLLLFIISRDYFVDRSPATENERRIRKAQQAITESDREAVQMFVNRLRKKLKHLQKWAKRENISCYRLYDADLPEYAVTIDRYNDSILIQEYPAPKHVNPEKVKQRFNSILAVLPEILDIPPAKIFLENDEFNSQDLRFS